mgnify:CR=1 FL=1
MKRLKEIVISRRRWGRGPTGGRLRDDETGLQCCLGFVCRAFGVPLSDIEGREMPDAVADRYKRRLPAWLLSQAGKSSVHKAARINDNSSLTDEKREARIMAIFKRHGLRAVFKP